LEREPARPEKDQKEREAEQGAASR